MEKKVMKIEYDKAGMVDGHFKMSKKQMLIDNEFTAFNLDIYQLCNLANIDTLMDYIDQEVDDKFAHQQLTRFLKQLSEQSQKILFAVQGIEKDMDVGERFTFDSPTGHGVKKIS